MKWQQLILAFIATICLIFAGNVLAQTDININNTKLIRVAGSVGGLVVFLINLFGLGVILLWKFGKEQPQMAS
jgi:hypothetical protein